MRVQPYLPNTNCWLVFAGKRGNSKIKKRGGKKIPPLNQVAYSMTKVLKITLTLSRILTL